ncbi:MAG: glycosyltransferase family 4 protein [Rhodobacteraceae bacterium]|nr:glycosyltransferase family 4 protein [Paracoccaceae bacterium]
MARGLMAALQDISPETAIDLASELRSWEGSGDETRQKRIMSDAKHEIEKVLEHPYAAKWQVWVTYHNYYKAPDLIGPEVSQHLGIPYVLVEASRSTKRLVGGWASFAAMAELACDLANPIFYLTERDRFALEQHKTPNQALIKLQPFLNQAKLPPLPESPPPSSTLLAVGMLRSGDKFESYRQLAEALAYLENPDWTLKIVGDGPAADEIRALYSAFDKRVTFLGLLGEEGVAQQMSNSTTLVWPGVNEAFGMVYLEAQAHGLPVIAQDRPGVRDVVAPACALTPPNDARAFANAIDDLLNNQNARKLAQGSLRSYIFQNHLRPSATALLGQQLQSLVKDAT